MFQSYDMFLECFIDCLIISSSSLDSANCITWFDGLMERFREAERISYLGCCCWYAKSDLIWTSIRMQCFSYFASIELNHKVWNYNRYKISIGWHFDMIPWSQYRKPKIQGYNLFSLLFAPFFQKRKEIEEREVAWFSPPFLLQTTVQAREENSLKPFLITLT